MVFGFLNNTMKVARGSHQQWLACILRLLKWWRRCSASISVLPNPEGVFLKFISIDAFNLKCSTGRSIEEAVESEGSASSSAKLGASRPKTEKLYATLGTKQNELCLTYFKANCRRELLHFIIHK